jgi:predicted RNase H-like nuclease (RuvC/YqgF family)
VQIISKVGTPVLIATDVKPTPFLVSKIAARFHIKVYTPSKSLSLAQKRRIGKGIFDPHIRDAYAAAVKAYRKYANRFRRIDVCYPEKSEEYKKLVLEGKAVGKAAKKH